MGSSTPLLQEVLAARTAAGQSSGTGLATNLCQWYYLEGVEGKHSPVPQLRVGLQQRH